MSSRSFKGLSCHRRTARCSASR